MSAVCVLFVVFIGSIYFVGYLHGFNNAFLRIGFMGQEKEAGVKISSTIPSPTPIVIERPVYPKKSTPSFGGPELWEAVNKRRTELGVNPLSSRSELCTIASIRLNELLEIGSLDAHEGFSNMPERREDLRWIFETYNLTEFLIQGAGTAEEAVSSWENTLGHSKLLTGGEYVWGCIYAQSGFGVAITAY